MSSPAGRYYDEFSIEGQRYIRVGERPYTRKRDGQQTVLAIWQANCVDCGEPFTIDHATRPVPIGPQRRCRPCAYVVRQAKSEKAYRQPIKPVGSAPDYTPAWPTVEEGQAELRTPSPAAVSHAKPSTPPKQAVKPAPIINGARRKGMFTDK